MDADRIDHNVVVVVVAAAVVVVAAVVVLLERKSRNAAVAVTAARIEAGVIGPGGAGGAVSRG